MQMHTDSHRSARATSGTSSNIRLLNLIDSGGSGTVFRALRTDPAGGDAEQMVAIKFPNGGADLSNEATALRSFEHDNVVQLLEHHAKDRRSELAGALVVELCQDGTVEDLVLRRALDASEVHFIVAAIGAALGEIHAKGWIHGDVNPSNVGLRPDSTPALFDFGTCRRADGSPTGEDIEGTEEFSQSLLPSSPIFDIRSLAATALWSLGDAGEFSPVDQQVAHGLTLFISRCDANEAGICLDDLYAVFDGVDSNRPVVSRPGGPSRRDEIHQLGARERTTGPLKPARTGPVRHAGGPGNPGGPQRPRTRRFGPGAGGTSDSRRPDDQRTPREFGKKVVGVVGLFALLSLMGIEIVGHTAQASANTPAGDVAAVVEMPTGTFVDASQTLVEHDVAWSIEEGSASFEIDGEMATFHPGLAGDHAAVGDWNCDGTSTLGVFRPDNGTWFTFDSWNVESTSTVERITGAESAQKLSVIVDERGCAAPYLR